jgi:hypothetical protein
MASLAGITSGAGVTAIPAVALCLPPLAGLALWRWRPNTSELRGKARRLAPAKVGMGGDTRMRRTQRRTDGKRGRVLR